MRRRKPVSPRLRARRAAALAGLGLLGSTVTACGPPEYRFHTSATNELVLKMPREWNQVRAGVPLGNDGQQAPAGNWLAMYDAAPRPSVAHVQSIHATSPTALVASQAVTKEVGGALTDDELRDQALPVSASGRAVAQLTGFTGKSFKLMLDEPVQTRTARGVHVVFTYDHGEGPEVYDQIAVTDSRRTRIHVLIVHCTKSCYDRHLSDIAATVRSFTVKLS